MRAIWIAAIAAALALPAMAAERPRAITDADYRATDPAVVAWGRLLFWDPILSGNREVSCGTCHHPRFGTGDGLALGLGDGGTGLGPARAPDPADPPERRIPRNAPALFNLGAHEFTVLFHDGRIEVDPGRPGGLRTPMADEMVEGFDTLLSAQTMFPVLSADEMAGHYGENEISRAVRMGRITGQGGAWDLIAARVRAVPAYAAMWEAAFPGDDALDFTDISDAIAQFMEAEWRSDDAPFDAWLRGQAPLPGPAAEGAGLFYGELGCAACHAGPFLTDHAFHAMGAPQLGPGKGERFEDHARDTGRMRVTGRAEDAYAFRTPSLRNVTETGPWGHAGAHDDLRAFLRDHAAPRRADWDALRPALPVLAAQDRRATDDPAERAAILAARRMPDRELSEGELDRLMAFLAALRDETALAGRLGIPDAVPSGLRVDR
jgi:cytochrome c peroxidase